MSSFSESGTIEDAAKMNVKHTSNSLCRHWERGFCQRGEKCAFIHNPKVPELEKERDTCRHWRRGICHLSNTCSFRHPADIGGHLQYTDIPNNKKIKRNKKRAAKVVSEVAGSSGVPILGALAAFSLDPKNSNPFYDYSQASAIIDASSTSFLANDIPSLLQACDPLNSSNSNLMYNSQMKPGPSGSGIEIEDLYNNWDQDNCLNKNDSSFANEFNVADSFANSLLDTVEATNSLLRMPDFLSLKVEDVDRVFEYLRKCGTGKRNSVPDTFESLLAKTEVKEESRRQSIAPGSGLLATPTPPRSQPEAILEEPFIFSKTSRASKRRSTVFTLAGHYRD